LSLNAWTSACVGGSEIISPPISPSTFPSVTAAWSAPAGCVTVVVGVAARA
jgi:hypothetical protein